MAHDFRLANEAWEAYYRAQAVITRELAEADIWGDLSTREYAVLHALSATPDGRRITELRDDVLLTQPGMSRLIDRLENRRLVERRDDAQDRRARRVCLTEEGAAAQRRVGAALARRIAGVMARSLEPDQLQTLRDVSLAILASTPGTAAAIQRQAIERTTS